MRAAEVFSLALHMFIPHNKRARRAGARPSRPGDRTLQTAKPPEASGPTRSEQLDLQWRSRKKPVESSQPLLTSGTDRQPKSGRPELVKSSVNSRQTSK